MARSTRIITLGVGTVVAVFMLLAFISINSFAGPFDYFKRSAPAVNSPGSEERSNIVDMQRSGIMMSPSLMKLMSTCGNGKIEPGEKCDVGSPISGQNCNENCQCIASGETACSKTPCCNSNDTCVTAQEQGDIIYSRCCRTQMGIYCTKNDECCSGSCVENKCCRAETSSCSDRDDCCADMVCSNGKCIYPTALPTQKVEEGGKCTAKNKSTGRTVSGTMKDGWCCADAGDCIECGGNNECS